MSACNAGDLGLIPGFGRSPGERKGYPLQYPCLENPMERGTWWATVHGASEGQTRLSDFTFFFSSFLSYLIKKMGRKHKNKIRGDKGETIKYRGSLKKLEIIFYLFAHVYLRYTVHTGFPNGSVKWTLYVWVIICLSVCS